MADPPNIDRNTDCNRRVSSPDRGSRREFFNDKYMEDNDKYYREREFDSYSKGEQSSRRMFEESNRNSYEEPYEYRGKNARQDSHESDVGDNRHNGYDERSYEKSDNGYAQRNNKHLARSFDEFEHERSSPFDADSKDRYVSDRYSDKKRPPNDFSQKSDYSDSRWNNDFSNGSMDAPKNKKFFDKSRKSYEQRDSVENDQWESDGNKRYDSVESNVDNRYESYNNDNVVESRKTKNDFKSDKWDTSKKSGKDRSHGDKEDSKSSESNSDNNSSQKEKVALLGKEPSKSYAPTPVTRERLEASEKEKEIRKNMTTLKRGVAIDKLEKIADKEKNDSAAKEKYISKPQPENSNAWVNNSSSGSNNNKSAPKNGDRPRQESKKNNNNNNASNNQTAPEVKTSSRASSTTSWAEKTAGNNNNNHDNKQATTDQNNKPDSTSTSNNGSNKNSTSSMTESYSSTSNKNNALKNPPAEPVISKLQSPLLETPSTTPLLPKVIVI